MAHASVFAALTIYVQNILQKEPPYEKMEVGLHTRPTQAYIVLHFILYLPPNSYITGER